MEILQENGRYNRFRFLLEVVFFSFSSFVVNHVFVTLQSYI